VVTVVVLRTLLGDTLRETRLRQRRTLKEVSQVAKVSLGYLSEVERGQKEASSELLASICAALGIRLSDVLRRVSEELAVIEPHPLPVAVPAPELVSVSGTVESDVTVAAA
jgi:transcriptional regulator with XRE-family HTH domain